jgi:hypothetical protein
VARKSIQTNLPVVACDVCGRTLLRGENADLFLHGGSRRTVCELCTSRAMHEGWIREGLDDALGRGGDRGGPRTLLGRLRSRRVERQDDLPVAEPVSFDEADTYHPASYDPDHYDPVVAAEGSGEPHVADPAVPVADDEFFEQPHEPVAAIPPAPHDGPPRERRNVNAVPTNAERKVARALEVFNSSTHTRTVAGVARSLGSPMVAARPSETEGSVVTIVVGWELSWYRYELDLADEAAGVRLTGQGGELGELALEDQSANATADDHGELHPLAAVA